MTGRNALRAFTIARPSVSDLLYAAVKTVITHVSLTFCRHASAACLLEALRLAFNLQSLNLPAGVFILQKSSSGPIYQTLSVDTRVSHIV